MGFFDKLKGAARAMTGGGASVQLHVDGQPTVSEPFTVHVSAQVKDAPIKIDAVYILVQAHEEVTLDASKVRASLSDHARDLLADGQLDGVTDREETCDLRVQIAPAQELEANQTYEWQGEIRLPAGALPSYRGRNARHVWRLQAGLDAFGNDPDSGWIDIHVS